MAVSQFPTRANAAFPSEPVGPAHLILVDVPPEYANRLKEFKDKGANIGLLTSNTVLRWDFTYDGLTQAEVAILDNHHNEAQDIFGGFQFRHPRSNILYSDCHYEVYEYPPHEQLEIQSRHIVLIKRPTG